MISLWRVIYRVYRISSWVRRWLARRFTRAGLAVFLAFIMAGLLGTDTENTVAYQAFALLFFLLAVAAIFGLRFKVNFSASRLLPRFATVDQPFTYPVRVTNHSRTSLRSLVLLEDLVDPRPSFQEWYDQQRAEGRRSRSFRVAAQGRNPYQMARVGEAAVPLIPPGQAGELQVIMTPLRRGVLRLKGLTLARPDPLGVYRALAGMALPQTVLVLPKRYPLPPLPFPGTMKYQDGGVALASNVGRSDEFVALRDYRHGDPLRHIHWRSWAKAGKPIVREFEDEFFVRHALVLDTFTAAPHSEVFEEAVSVAASFACTIPAQESLLDLLFVGARAYCFTAGRGLAHSAQLLEVLAGVQACTDKPFSTLEPLVLNHMTSASGCICVLMAWDAVRQEFVKKLKLQGVPLLVLVVVERGWDAALDPGPLRDEPESFRVVEAGKLEEQLAQL